MLDNIPSLVAFVLLGVGVGFALRRLVDLLGRIERVEREVRFWRRMVNEANFLDSLGRPCKYRNGMPVPFAPNGLPHKYDEEGLLSNGRLAERALMQINARLTPDQILAQLAPDVSLRIDGLSSRVEALAALAELHNSNAQR